MKVISSLLASSSNLLASLGAICIVGMLAVVSLDVFGRVIFSKPLPETIELVSNIFMVGLIFLPLSLAVRNDVLLKAETFSGLFPRPVLRVFRRLVPALTAPFLLILAYAATLRAIRSTRIWESAFGTTFDIPVWPSRWLVALCFLIAGIVAFSKIFQSAEQGDVK